MFPPLPLDEQALVLSRRELESMSVREFNNEERSTAPLDKFNVVVSPGEIDDTEFAVHNDYEAVLRLIPGWCARVRQDLHHRNPRKADTELDELRRQIEREVSKQSDSEESFSVDEIAALHDKLDRLAERINELAEQELYHRGHTCRCGK